MTVGIPAVLRHSRWARYRRTRPGKSGHAVNVRLSAGRMWL
jgi:hypothetical protein